MDHFVVEADRAAVGVAIRVPGGFRFFHSDPRFRKLDGQVFRRARTLASKVRELAGKLRKGARRL
jgi:hypothetical protein